MKIIKQDKKVDSTDYTIEVRRYKKKEILVNSDELETKINSLKVKKTKKELLLDDIKLDLIDIDLQIEELEELQDLIKE